jgi:hypothetical protein
MRYYNIIERYEQVLQNLRKNAASEPQKTAALDRAMVATDAFINYFGKNRLMDTLTQNPDAAAVQQQQMQVSQAFQQADQIFSSPQFASLYLAPSDAQIVQQMAPQMQNLLNALSLIGQFVPVKAQQMLQASVKELMNAIKVLQS